MIVSYKDGVLKEEDRETPRASLKEFAEPPMTKAQLDAEVKRIFKSMTLLPVGEASESGGQPAPQRNVEVFFDQLPGRLPRP